MLFESPRCMLVGARWLGVLTLSVALAACGGGGKKGGNRGVVGDSPEDLGVGELRGRWAVTYAMGTNSCGFLTSTENLLFDVSHFDNEVTFKEVGGEGGFTGRLEGNVLTAEGEEETEDYIVTDTTTLVFSGSDSFSGEETFTCQPVQGGKAGSGKVQITGKREGEAPSKPGNPTPPGDDTDEPTGPETPTTPPGTNADREPNNTVDVAGTISIGASISGTVNNVGDDIDIFAFSASRSDEYEITLSGFAGNDLDVAVVQMVNNEPQLVNVSEAGPGIEESLTIQGASTSQSTLYIVVFASDTAATDSEYILRLTRQ